MLTSALQPMRLLWGSPDSSPFLYATAALYVLVISNIFLFLITTFL